MNAQDHTIKHIAFIVDGNRRWAKERGLNSLEGHKQGFQLLVDIDAILRNYGITHATYYVFSTENWNRSPEEVSYLMDLFRVIFQNERERMVNSGVCFRAIGDREKLPIDIQEKLCDLEKATAHNKDFYTTCAISYGGRNEIVRATKKIAVDVASGKIDAKALTEDMFASYLDTSGLPYPDIIVRSSEKRLSNFLIWQLAYSEIFFIDKLWPDFTEHDIKCIIEEFSQRKRRYGK